MLIYYLYPWFPQPCATPATNGVTVRLPDFDRRRRLLAEMMAAPLDAPRLAELRRGWRRGAVKLALTLRLLALRRAAPRLFADGEHVALEAAGSAAGHLCVFARRVGGACALVVVPRLTVALAAEEGWPLGEAIWRDTTVPWPSPIPPPTPGSVPAPEDGTATDWLTGRRVETSQGRIAVARLLDVLPVAVVVTGEVAGAG
jgi:(1->4)-alpha-D-glucan 1-alpha-D-glucosylmutase